MGKKKKSTLKAKSIKNKIRHSYEKEIFDLKQLLEISKSLNSTLDYSILIDSILFTCMAQVRVLKVGIYAKKSIDNSDFILNRNYKGFEVDHSRKYMFPADHPLLSYLNQHPNCITMEEIGKICKTDDYIDALREIQPHLIVPMVVKEKVNGFIILGERLDGEDISKKEYLYLFNVALLAAIAIHNAFLFEMTTTDMMTKLKIRHYFETALISRMDEAKAYGLPVSLIMMDIDHFKRLNDTYGHTCGDMVIKKVAATIQSCVRQLDTAARYGGEEFAVILPEAGIEKANDIAKRIRQKVEEMIIEYKDHKIKVTISLGVAEFSLHKDTENRVFIDRADKALYHSKQQGRNRVTLAE